MNEKIDALVKYSADTLRTFGIACVLTGAFGLVFERPETLTRLPETLTTMIVGGVLIATGWLCVLIYTPAKAPSKKES
ncbi:TPA: hypothetical protein I7682_17850 [Vibrio vulnificus]|nr:hypothetical protein [Vibrio vulnificus]